ncbi:MAG: alanyl-tRNA editing protein [Anaerolineae bacterium]|nr:alanyl-tRNA editing protein [Anaerolineae bacterium]
MVTELLYQTNAYVRQFTAQVIDTQDGALVLDRTAFYPGGGGQEADHGTIRYLNADYALAKLRKVGALVLHWVQKQDAYPLPLVGSAVQGHVDWDRRYKLMRTHTALHILCGVIWRDYGALVTGGNMHPLRARMDFELEQMSADFASEVETKVNAEVTAARDVIVRVLPRAEAFQIPDLIRTKIDLLPEGIEQVRVVEIVGLDLQADGGTHVANTREVGRIRVVGHESKGRINKRLRIELEE